MSYSLPMRALQALRRKPGAKLFQENLDNVLSASTPLPEKTWLLAEMDTSAAALRALADRWRELAMLDLSPTGAYFSQGRTHSGIACLWNAYNTYSEVLDRSELTQHGIKPQKQISKPHACLLEAYETFFEQAMGRNRQRTAGPSPQLGLNLKDVARVLDAPSLIQDACDYFLSHPRARVCDLYGAMGLHPRTAERRFAAEGLAAVKIKRACAVSSASQYILWSNLSLADIAQRFGYTDTAHLHHEFKRSTGGIPPSVYRQAGRLSH